MLAGNTPVLVHNNNKCDPWDELADYRAREGMPAAGSVDDVHTAARLQLDGHDPLFGRNGHGRSVDIKVNAQTRTHAEGDVFQQAKDAGITARTGTLHVDRGFCRSCGATGGVGSLMRGIGMEELIAHTPSGRYRITADWPSVPVRLED